MQGSQGLRAAQGDPGDPGREVHHTLSVYTLLFSSFWMKAVEACAYEWNCCGLMLQWVVKNNQMFSVWTQGERGKRGKNGSPGSPGTRGAAGAQVRKYKKSKMSFTNTLSVDWYFSWFDSSDNLIHCPLEITFNDIFFCYRCPSLMKGSPGIPGVKGEKVALYMIVASLMFSLAHDS